MLPFFMFEIYSREGCGYCVKLMAVLGKKGIPYTEKKLDRDFTREEFIEQFGDKGTFPRVLHEGELIGGMSEAVKFLSENNYV